MALYQLITLDEMEQAEAVWEGVHIAGREDEDQRILLYQIDSFYVEVFYHKGYNVIRKFRPFAPVNQLEPYLSRINLKG
jgi:hypothetical protein